MQSIAAYYVVVAGDLSNRPARHPYAVVETRPSRFARVVARLSALVGTGRPAVAQPA